MSEEKNSLSIQEIAADREKVIIRTSITGIVANVLLAAFKAVIGLLSNSIAVVLDAVNNLSDAVSSVVTIVGTKLSNKKPDKKHPLGYGRIEYLTAMIVAGIVLYAGITSAVESVKKIIEPEPADYSVISLVIIAAAVVVKFILGRYVKAKGKKVNSSSLIASGSDATFDAILSLSVLACAVFFLITGISLEAYVGVVIAAFIIKAGIEMMIETLNDILGKRSDPETVKQVKAIINEEPEIKGAFDLFIYNYGPEKNYASVHIELPDTMTVEDTDRLTRKIQKKVYAETGIILTGVGVYSYNTKNDEAARIRNSITEAVMSHEWALQMHGFYADTESKEIRFDVVLSFDVDPKEALKELYGQVGAMFPDYTVAIAPDIDV